MDISAIYTFSKCIRSIIEPGVSDLSLTEYKDITDFPSTICRSTTAACAAVRQGMTIYRPRGRRDHYLLYLQSGKVLIQQGEDMIPLKEGSCLYYPPHTPHLYTFADDRPASYYYVHFAGEAADESMAMVSPRADGLYGSRTGHIQSVPSVAYDCTTPSCTGTKRMAFRINGVLLERSVP